MAGRPKKRLALSKLREQVLARDDPRVLPGFTTWPDARKLEWILGASLDQAATVCTWSVSELDPARLAIWDRVRHGIWMVSLRMTEWRERRMSEAELERMHREAEEAAARAPSARNKAQQG